MLPRALLPYAAFYFFFYGGLGAYTPYVARFVESLGHGGLVAGAMLGIWYASRIVAPPVWAKAVERSATPGWWFVGGCLAITASFAAFTLAQSVPALLLVMAAFGLFYNALMPQFEAMTLQALGPDAHAYGRVRVWGSISFMLVAASYGSLLDHVGASAFPWVTLPWFIAMTAAALPWRTITTPATPMRPVSAGSFRSLWRRPGVSALLWMSFFAQAGFGAYYVFFTLHLQRAGHDGLVIGLLWAVGVLVEVGLFFLAPALLRRFPVHQVMTWCLAITAVRWAMTAVFAEQLLVLTLLQATHALSYALLHACTMTHMATLFPQADGPRGQSLLYGFSSGGGGVAGAAVAALLWEWQGGLAAFFGGAVITVGALVALRQQPPTPAAQANG